MPTTSVDFSGAIARSLATKDLAANIKQRITSRALVTLKRRLGPEAARELGAVLNLPKREINSRISVSSTDDFVDLTGSGKRIPLGKFGAKWGGPKTAGATAQIFVDGAPRTYVAAFALPNGAIVARALSSGSKRVPRLPIQPLFGPDVGSVMVSHSAHGTLDGLNQFSYDTLTTELERLTGVEMALL